ncbi:MAG: hypothetical protein ACPGWR_07905 [Ardenticatenaceae bacterium]
MIKNQKRVDEIEVLSTQDVHVGMKYPYLPTEWKWEIHNIPFSLLDQAEPNPTVRLVKDNKVIDIHVPSMNTNEFLAHWGLRPHLSRGGYILCKRFSRLIHPYRYWTFLNPDEVKIVHREDWDADLWDGCGRVSKRFIRDHLLPRLSDLPEEKRRKYERELLHTGRFEITVMHEGGQEKGDCIVFDELPDGADFMFPAGSAKSEFAQEGLVFVGLATARHPKDGMRFDPQSLINLHPFITPFELLEWAEWESGVFLEALGEGKVGQIYSRLAADEESLEKLSNWHVAEYIASGGDSRWFAGITRELGKQHLNRIKHKTKGKLRFPAPGGRYYIMPAVVGEKCVPRGHIELDHHNATAWVNDQDWCEYLVELLGGCDGDDGLWILPFTDWDGSRQILAWRSPNQLGEYVVLKPTPNSHQIKWTIPGGRFVSYIPMDSRLLPPRVDTVAYEYAELSELDVDSTGDKTYTVEAMDTSIQLAIGNQGTLGGFCNILMITKALYGRLPLQLPATLETIIDGSVKKFIDLQPVKEWIALAALAIVNQGKPVPACLMDRLKPLLPKKDRGRVVVSTGHWLDQLMNGIGAHQEEYLITLNEVANTAQPPVSLFGAIDPAWKPFGKEFRARYADALRTSRNQEQARISCGAFLDEVPTAARTMVLLAASAYCYTLGKEDDSAHFSDNCVWQLGEKEAAGGRTPGIAHMFISALRQIGLIGEPVWTKEGAILAYTATHKYSGIPVTFNGTWFNWLRSVSPEIPTNMGMIQKEVRDKAKAVIAKLTDTKFIKMVLIMEKKGNRLVARTTQGNLFGYIEKGHEKRLGSHRTWQIEWATATDGNVHAILRPAAGHITQLTLRLPPVPAPANISRPQGAKTKPLTVRRSRGAKQLELPFDTKPLDTPASAPVPVQLSLWEKAA